MEGLDLRVVAILVTVLLAWSSLLIGALKFLKDLCVIWLFGCF